MNDQPQKSIDWNVIKRRLLTRGPEDQWLSAISGNETDAELREIITRFVEFQCPIHEQQEGCPFQTLGGLTHASLNHFIAELKRDSLLFLFAAELECRSKHCAKQLVDQTDQTRQPT